MDRLALNQNFTKLNSELNLFTRRESGIFESISNLMQVALSTDANAESLATLTESVAIKMLASPLHAHTSSLCSLVQSLLQNTNAEYHL